MTAESPVPFSPPMAGFWLANAALTGSDDDLDRVLGMVGSLCPDGQKIARRHADMALEFHAQISPAVASEAHERIRAREFAAAVVSAMEAGAV